ncbi:dodecin, partial [Actinoplanes nipponensis]
ATAFLVAVLALTAVATADPADPGRGRRSATPGIRSRRAGRGAAPVRQGGGHRFKPEEAVMSNHVYRLSEVVGSSPTSVDDAIRTAIRKAAQTVRNIDWFETQEIRGQVVDGDIAYFQVRMKIGFRVED